MPEGVVIEVRVDLLHHLVCKDPDILASILLIIVLRFLKFIYFDATKN